MKLTSGIGPDQDKKIAKVSNCVDLRANDECAITNRYDALNL